MQWHDAGSGQRKGIKRSYRSRAEAEAEAEAWIQQMQRAATTGIDPAQTLTSVAAYLDGRWAPRNGTSTREKLDASVVYMSRNSSA